MNEDHDTFWFMSFRGPAGVSQLSGTFKKAPNATRSSAFEQILATVREQQPHLTDAVVVSFDIRPNKLDW